jgi:hypothetical protein
MKRRSVRTGGLGCACAATYRGPRGRETFRGGEPIPVRKADLPVGAVACMCLHRRPLLRTSDGQHVNPALVPRPHQFARGDPALRVGLPKQAPAAVRPTVLVLTADAGHSKVLTRDKWTLTQPLHPLWRTTVDPAARVARLPVPARWPNVGWPPVYDCDSCQVARSVPEGGRKVLRSVPE